MKFRTAYCDRQHFRTLSGSRYRKSYIRTVADDGSSRLIENGQEDVYDSIQKAALGIRLEDLIRRARAGDADAIPAPVESYADLTGAPSDLLEAHHMLQSAKDKYLQLPADLRAKFNNSFDDFLAASVDGTLVKVLSESAAAQSVTPLSADELTKIRNVIGGNNNA